MLGLGDGEDGGFVGVGGGGRAGERDCFVGGGDVGGGGVGGGVDGDGVDAEGFGGADDADLGVSEGGCIGSGLRTAISPRLAINNVLMDCILIA